MGNVVVFAPSPVLTVTIEGHAGIDVHVHAGGQGVWQARMLLALGTSVTMCSVLAGETGVVLRHLIEDEGIRMEALTGTGHNGAYIHDRRGGKRISIAETAGAPLSRHELDALYGSTLRAGMDAGTVILSGPVGEDTVPPDVYRRLASDLGTAGCRVIADLAGERLTAALAGGLSVIKVSHEELIADGRAATSQSADLVAAMHRLGAEGAASIIVTRGEHPSLLLADSEVSEVRMPALETVDSRGAGDSLTAGVAATLASGGTIKDAAALGAAAGALNVTRHGLGTGEAETVYKLRELVRIHPLESAALPDEQISPDQLARRVKEK